MALRDQPYLPLYVNDFVSDEKLRNCSAESTGVYIRLMCYMHRSQEYGKVLLRQNERQNERQVLNFAAVLAKQMPYGIDVIARSLDELLEYGIVYIDGDALCQKRMIKDGSISEIRSKSGKKGAESSNKRFMKESSFAAAKRAAKATAKAAANSENEDEDDIDTETEIKNGESNGFGKVMDFYMDRLNPTPSSQIVDDLKTYCETLDWDVVIHAMQIAIDERKFAWSYINAILRRYAQEGLTTMSAVLQQEQERKGKQKSGGGKKQTFLDMYLEDEG